MANTYSLNLELDSTQYAYIADTASLSITGNLTIECWVNIESTPTTGNQMAFVSKYGTSYMFRIINPSGTLQLGFSETADGVNFKSAVVNWTPTLGIWYHLAVVYTAAAGSAAFFVNGVQQGTTQTGLDNSLHNSADEFRIGAKADGTQLFDGLIDDVRVWATTKSAADILASMKKELVGNETNLNGYWKLNNNYLDETSNNNDLTASGSPTFSTNLPFYDNSGFLNIL